MGFNVIRIADGDLAGDWVEIAPDRWSRMVGEVTQRSILAFLESEANRITDAGVAGIALPTRESLLAQGGELRRVGS